jgi:hypothetical protein
VKVSGEWKKLTGTQRRAWNAWARNNPVLLDDGSVRRVSGRKALTMVVRRRAMAGEAASPTVQPVIGDWQQGLLSVDDAGPFTENAGFVGFRTTDDIEVGQKFFVWATPPVSAAETNPHAKLRFVTCWTSPGVGSGDLISINAAYLAVNGSWDGPGVDGEWPEPMFVWFRVHHYANGQLGPGLVLKGLIHVQL